METHEEWEEWAERGLVVYTPRRVVENTGKVARAPGRGVGDQRGATSCPESLESLSTCAQTALSMATISSVPILVRRHWGHCLICRALFRLFNAHGWFFLRWKPWSMAWQCGCLVLSGVLEPQVQRLVAEIRQERGLSQNILVSLFLKKAKINPCSPLLRNQNYWVYRCILGKLVLWLEYGMPPPNPHSKNTRLEYLAPAGGTDWEDCGTFRRWSLAGGSGSLGVGLEVL